MDNFFNKMFCFEADLKKEIYSLPVESLNKGAITIKQNSYIKSIPLLLKGNLRVYRQTQDREILFYYIQEGGTCGMSLAACLDRKIMNSEIIAVERSEVLWIPQQKVSEWLYKYHSWNDFIISTFARRQMQLVEAVDEIAFNKIDKRIIAYLNDLCEERKSNTISITHQELANDLGTTRVVISRILKNMEGKGSIELLRGAIKIKNLPQLVIRSW